MEAKVPFYSLTKYDLPDAAALFYLPNGADRKVFYSIFLSEYGDMMPIYQEPERLAEHIRATGISLKYSLDKLYASLSFEYNPIENYDRVEEWHDSGDKTTTYAGKEKVHDDVNGFTDYVGKQKNKTGERSTEHRVSADNAGTEYYPHEKDISPEVTDSIEYEGRRDAAESHNDSTRSFENRTDSDAFGSWHTGRVHGNIGVTTSQMMLQSERDLVRYNFYHEAAEMYATKLLVMVY